MPIRPEMRALYPPNWKEIRASILERAGNRCEGSPRYPDCRAANGEPHPITGSKVVLTIGHLNHRPEDSDPAVLRAWCNRCHLTYDGPEHARNAAATRAVRRAGYQVRVLPQLHRLLWGDRRGA